MLPVLNLMVSMRLQSLEIIVLIAQIKYHILNCYYAPILEDVFCVAANGDAVACWQAQCCHRLGCDSVVVG